MKVIRAIGAGGFGNVDLVEDELGRQFARKTFSQNQPLDAKMLENVKKRFAKEANIQSAIKHQNIVPVLYSDMGANPPHYTMPLAICSLADDIANDPTLGGNFISALSDIVAGLEEIHSLEIYHRDLKPQNVLKFENPNIPGTFYYAISDFGLISMKDSRLSVLTSTGMVKGSDYFTAPEIHKDLKKASVQSDIYSLGCILHDMIGIDDRMPCGEIRENGELSAILIGCTHKDPKKRFKSARAVLDAILSIELAPAGQVSLQSADYLSALDGEVPPPPDFWPRLNDFLEHEATPTDRAALFGKLTSDRARHICDVALESGSIIGVEFAHWVAKTQFNFDYCDAIANRLETFVEVGNLECKAECLMAMLAMGTSHNRWLVEQKFYRLCGPTMEEQLAKRLAIQLRIADKTACDQIAHLERSIKVDRQYLHPIVVSTLHSICQ